MLQSRFVVPNYCEERLIVQALLMYNDIHS